MTAEATVRALDVMPGCAGDVMSDGAQPCSVTPAKIVLGTDLMGDDVVAVYVAVCVFHAAAARAYFGQTCGSWTVPCDVQVLREVLREDLVEGRIASAWQMLPKAMAG